MNGSLISVALTSSLIAGIVSVLCAGAFNLWSIQQQYKNEYYKKVIERRIVAHDLLGRLVNNFKTSLVDSDRKPYHLTFSDDSVDFGLYVVLGRITSEALWMSVGAFRKAQEINKMLFNLPQDTDGRVAFGKVNYERFAILRNELEIIIAKDAIELYKVHKFLKSKVRDVSGFEHFDFDEPRRPGSQ